MHGVRCMYEDFEMFENMQDLQYYYENGYHLEENKKLGNLLTNAIDDYMETPKRDFTSLFLLPIDNCLPVSGRGTVVVGTLKRGIVSKNDKVDLLGFDEQITTSVGDIQVFKQSLPSAKAGENVGLLIRGVKPKRVRKSMMLCPINTIVMHNCFKATFYFLLRFEGGRSKPITSNYQQQCFSYTWNIVCRINLDPSMTMITPEEHADVQITFLNKMIMDIGPPFTIRENGRIVATGILSIILPNVHLTKNHLSSIQRIAKI